MQKQTYHIGKLLIDANVKNIKVPLQVNCCGFNASEGYSELKRIRKDYYFLYVMNGKIEYDNDVISEGDIIVFESEREISYKKKGDFSYLWLHFTGFEAVGLISETIGMMNRKIHIGYHKDIEELFEKLFKEFIIKDKYFETVTVCILKEIMSLTARYMNKSSVPLKSIAYIHENYDENISVKHLADMEELSLTAYRNLFKKHTGVSPNDYLINLRVNIACRLLSQTNERIGDIANKVGYTDQYYFSRIFSGKMKVSPREYRKRIK